MPVRTVIERGPRESDRLQHRLARLESGARTVELAIDTLDPIGTATVRSQPCRDGARVRRRRAPRVVEDTVGTGSTTSRACRSHPARPSTERLDKPELERPTTLLRACWAFFDDVADGSRRDAQRAAGGGRDRNRIVRHTIRTESEEFAKQLGLRIPEEGALTPDGLRRHRESYLAAIRAYNDGQIKRPMRSWTLPFLIRHSADHMLDHTWEMQDKDLSGESQSGDAE